MNVKNAHVRKVIQVARSRISHHLLQKVVTLRVHSDWQLWTVCSNAFDQVSLIQQCLDSGQYL